MTRPFTLTANDARRLVLHLQGLTDPPRRKLPPPAWLSLIERLGFVQVDSINRVERAHHMILFTRNQTYRSSHLRAPLEVDGTLFENWTHDAAIIPTRFYPHWHERFRRERRRLAERFRRWQGDGYRAEIDRVLARLEDEGPLMARDFADGKRRGSGGWWDWHPGKAALEFLWRTGEIAIARREGFQKVYDLAGRVIPTAHRNMRYGAEQTVDWACKAALDRLGFASPGEIAGFWGLITADEAKAWCHANLGVNAIPAVVEGVGTAPRKVFAPADIESRLADLPPPPARLRVLNPFDPLLRDRKRLSRLFGFDYRIEIFVPEGRRRYGYYIFPLLEGERLTGRIDLRADRDADRLEVTALWLERGCRATPARLRRLESELERMRRFAGLSAVGFAKGYLRAPA